MWRLARDRNTCDMPLWSPGHRLGLSCLLQVQPFYLVYLHTLMSHTLSCSEDIPVHVLMSWNDYVCRGFWFDAWKFGVVRLQTNSNATPTLLILLHLFDHMRNLSVLLLSLIFCVCSYCISTVWHVICGVMLVYIDIPLSIFTYHSYLW